MSDANGNGTRSVHWPATTILAAAGVVVTLMAGWSTGLLRFGSVESRLLVIEREQALVSPAAFSAITGRVQALEKSNDDLHEEMHRMQAALAEHGAIAAHIAAIDAAIVAIDRRSEMRDQAITSAIDKLSDRVNGLVVVPGPQRR